MFLSRVPEEVHEIYLCGTCGTAHTDDDDQRHLDKCEICRGDDWIYFRREKEEPK